MAQNITLLGANYPDVPAVQLPITGGGTATFSDTRSVTYNLTGGATASVTPFEVVAGQGFSLKLKAPAGYNLSNVSVTMGGVDITSQVFEYDEGGGGGSPSATQHSIYFEFSDSTNTTITAYYDDSFISSAITATTPTTYGGKTVTLAQLDGVTWYQAGGGDIPLNTELVDYTAVRTGYYVDDTANGAIVAGESWDCVTDYIQIDPSMTFSFASKAWYGVGFYDSSKNPVRGIVANDLGTVSNDYVHGTITPSVIPSNAVYCVLTGNPYALSSNYLSLIRTA